MLQMAAEVNSAVRSMSDVMNGAVSTLIGEGWTEEQARELVVAVFVSGMRQRAGQQAADAEDAEAGGDE